MEVDNQFERENAGEIGMIPAREIREKSRSNGVPESTIERDYAQNWLLGLLFTRGTRLVLKGGTGIRKTYIPNYSFSDDLDFSLLDDIDLDTMKDFILETVENTREDSGIDFHDEITLSENVNGYEVNVYFRLLRTTGSPIGIKLDLTKPDMEKLVLSPQKREVIHPYSDDCKFEVFVYLLEEIMAEKIRSLFERTRPRDLYDVWFFKDKLEKDVVIKIFSEKCKFKGLKPDINSIRRRGDDFRNAWENSLGHQLKSLPDFSNTFNAVLKWLKRFI